MSKIVVGMSGGVDSAVTAYLLKAAGYEVIGVTLKTWQSENEVSRCCEIDDARSICDKLDIPYYTRNVCADFRREVVQPFIDEYIAGRTPNPCVVCNRTVKWSHLLEAADDLGAQLVATGHYASVEQLENGRFTVKNADFSEKDQTYMLYRLSQEQLARTIMPLGKLSKSEVRKIAEQAALPVASKPDSQEICFVPDNDYADFICSASDYEPYEGDFVDENGNVIGKHKGIIHYTVGQRRGLGLAMGRPVFVKRIDADKNEVVVCEDASLWTSEIIVGSLNFQSIPDISADEKLRASVKVRYRHSGTAALIERIDESRVKVTFDSPVRAATPGQSAVFYDELGRIIGGGFIQ